MSKKYKMTDYGDAEEVGAASDSETSELLSAPVAPAVPETIEPPKAPIKEYLALRVFVTIAGPKWDQMAGFVSHARSKNLGLLTMEDWQAEFKKFQEKPVS